MRDVITVDFETEAIRSRPHYPPRPVGVALLSPGQGPQYLAWGHPCENNCTREYAYHRLQSIWRGRDALLMHNAKFDLEVALKEFGLPLRPRSGFVHDTLILGYLAHPRADKLSLKDLAQVHLNMPPEEQAQLRDWILAHDKTIPKSHWGAYISTAPGSMVAPYAKGDVIRTFRLFQLWRFHSKAYARELELIPNLIEMERAGVPIDVPALESDTAQLDKGVDDVSLWLIERLGPIDLDSPKQLADALEEKGLIKKNSDGTSAWILTEKGNRSTSRNALDAVLTDAKVRAALQYRREANTCLRTFARPWLAQAQNLKGRIACNWHQVRQPSERKRGLVGTRTGRLSSSPNFQNMPNPFAHYALPLELPPLPRMRQYIVPPQGHVLGQADFSQQELRILAHYIGGSFRQAYQEDPRVDIHHFMQELIGAQTGKTYSRKTIKTIAFALIYGMGIKGLAQAIGTNDLREVKQLRRLYMSASGGGIEKLYSAMAHRAACNEAITTWGGRRYYCEPAKFVDGRYMTFDYKMVNLLIQGSAADAMKETINRYFRVKPNNVQVILTVHDEIVLLIPTRAPERIAAIMDELVDVMLSLEFDVPMAVDWKWSARSFADLKGATMV